MIHIRAAGTSAMPGASTTAARSSALRTARAGDVAPRCQYFELAINDTPWGLYLDQEDCSDKQALRDRGFHADSNVYRGFPQSFSDWSPARDEWEKVTNEESPFTDLEECVHVVARTPQHRFLEALPRYFDLDELIDLLAWHAILGMGVISDASYYYIHDATADRWHTVPHDATVGETHPAYGDVDGDGLDELVVGFGSFPSNGGWVQVRDDAEVIIGLEQGGECRLEVFDDALAGHAHMEWLQVGEEPYRTAVGATRPALADMDADGDADLAVGFVRGGQERVEVWRRSTSTGQYVPWWTREVPGPGGYAAANGETWPAFGIRRWSR